jgi:hypothetical protein
MPEPSQRDWPDATPASLPHATSGLAHPSPLSADYWTEPLSRGCNTCRVTGTATFAGISGCLLFQRAAVEKAARGHRLALAGMAGGFAAAAVLRWFA